MVDKIDEYGIKELQELRNLSQECFHMYVENLEKLTLKNLEFYPLVYESFEIYKKDAMKIIEERCKEIGKTPESVLEKLLKIHSGMVRGEIKDKDELSVFVSGYYYCLATIKKEEGKILESLAALFVSLEFLTAYLEKKRQNFARSSIPKDYC
jgi:hypothetical protein